MGKWLVRIVILGILPALIIMTTLSPRRYSETQEFMLSQFDTLVADSETFVLIQSDYPFTIDNNTGFRLPSEAAYLDAFDLSAGLSYHLVDVLPAGEYALRHSGSVSVFLFDTDTDSTVFLHPTAIKVVLVLGITVFFWFMFLLAFLSQERDYKRYPPPAVS